MNNLTINGNLVRDMEIKDVKGLLIGEFTIANNQRVGKDKDETTFLKCTLFGNRVEALEKYLVKGAKVLVTGRLSIANIESEDGYKTYVSCIVDNLEIEKFVEAEEQPKKSSKYNKYKK